MASAIGKLAISIVADAVGVQTGVDAAKGALTRFDAWVSTLFTETFKGGLLGMAGRGFAGIVDIVGTTVEKIQNKWSEVAPAIKESFMNAQRLGVSTEDAMALEGIFGPDRMMRLMRARAGIQGDLIKEFMLGADQVKGMKDAGEQAAFIAKELHFGKRAAADLVPIFNKGAEGLQAQLDLYKEILGVTDTQAARVTSALKAWKGYELMWKGFWNQIIVGMAPAVEVIGKMFSSVAPTVVRVGKLLGIALGDSLFVGAKIIENIVDRVLQFSGVSGGLTGLMEGSKNWDTKNFQETFRAGLSEWVGRMSEWFSKLYDAILRLIQALGSFGIAVSEFGLHMGERFPHFFGGMKDFFRGSIIVAEQMRKWATDQRFLNDPEKVGERARDFMGGIFAKLDAAQFNRQFGAGNMVPYQAVGAAVMNTKEAFSAIAKFSTEGELGKDAAQRAQDARERQIEELKQVKALLARLVDRRDELPLAAPIEAILKGVGVL